ncbi:MAG: hypothetical protein K2X27_16820 [Candidatus Obscuribacterales bacterium]|nr:hypothetical protein [Candidatus Obscuribacterales bacterium]
MTKNTATKEPEIAQKSVAAGNLSPSLPQKGKLEKTQSLLSVISTSIGLLGVAGSVFAYGLSSFYTGSIELVEAKETPGVVVKVYTREGHESVFHARHIDLMPGDYHLEISSPEGKVVHVNPTVRFHETSKIQLSFTSPSNKDADREFKTDKKKRWWQFWRRSAEEAKSTAQEESSSEN